jgi:hypothetical protein
VHVANRRDRAGEVRHNPDFVQVAERHDFEHLGNAADIRQGGSCKVDIALFDQRSEIRAGAIRLHTSTDSAKSKLW